MARRKDMQVRVDREIWQRARVSLLGMSDSEISKVLFNTSIIRVKDPMGKFVYGKQAWSNATKPPLNNRRGRKRKI